MSGSVVDRAVDNEESRTSMSLNEGAVRMEPESTAGPVTDPVVHHIAVQTADFRQSVAWYQDFFGCTVNWTLDTFSDLTRSRLPGITKIAELVVGGTRFHVFDRATGLDQPPPTGCQQYQHVCLDAGSPEAIRTWRQRWMEIYDSDRYSFTVREPATEVVVDGDGVQSFYCLDVNGLEFEFTYDPAGDR